MKRFSTLAAMVFTIIVWAQPSAPQAPLHEFSNLELIDFGAERKQGWLIRGTNTITFTQNAFSNWVAGGVDAYALNANLDYEFNHTKGKHIWDNRVILAYGFQKQEDQGRRKTNDVIDLNSLYGYQIKPKWYASGQVNFRSQFDEGIDFEEDGDPKISNIFAPAYLRLGAGVDYRPSDNFSVTFHPVTSRFTFVFDEDLQVAGLYGLENDGDNLFFELGTFLGARHQWNISERIGFNQQINLYSNYLKDTKNVDVLYNSRLNLNVNRFITTELIFDLMYDDNQIGRSQIRQSLGVGFTYTFDNAPKKSDLEKAQAAFDEAKAALEAAKSAEAEKQAAEETNTSATDVEEKTKEAQNTSDSVNDALNGEDPNEQ